jgi:hypothetical protein
MPWQRDRRRHANILCAPTTPGHGAAQALVRHGPTSECRFDRKRGLGFMAPDLTSRLAPVFVGYRRAVEDGVGEEVGGREYPRN